MPTVKQIMEVFDDLRTRGVVKSYEGGSGNKWRDAALLRELEREGYIEHVHERPPVHNVVNTAPEVV